MGKCSKKQFAQVKNRHFSHFPQYDNNTDYINILLSFPPHILLWQVLGVQLPVTLLA